MDEVTGKQVGPARPPPALNADGSLNYDAVLANYDEYMGWLAEVYANTMNVIHFMVSECAAGSAALGTALSCVPHHHMMRAASAAPLIPAPFPPATLPVVQHDK